jgi:hypothetical protein
MDRKQEENLRVLLEGRKRAEKVLAKRHEEEQKRLDEKIRQSANQEVLDRYTEKITELAQESGILAMVEQAVLDRKARLVKQAGYYVDYGFATSRLQAYILQLEDQGKLRVAYLALRIIWQEAALHNEVEVRVYLNGQITFHDWFLPVFPIFWRREPNLLQKRFTRALEHPRQKANPPKKK